MVDDIVRVRSFVIGMGIDSVYEVRSSDGREACDEDCAMGGPRMMLLLSIEGLKLSGGEREGEVDSSPALNVFADWYCRGAIVRALSELIHCKDANSKVVGQVKRAPASKMAHEGTVSPIIYDGCRFRT
jgi:hypothetical protein